MLSQGLVVVAFSLLFAAVHGQDVVSDCPIPNGYFADSVQCDKYYECSDNILTEKLCADGMAFNDLNHRVGKCDFTYQIDCTTRPGLQPAQATENCPRANGYFPHHEPNRCNDFFFCSQGSPNALACPETLVFSTKTGTCVWPDEAGRTDDCIASKVVDFICPKVPDFEAVAHPRYADPNDCQFFYVCINGKVPRHNGCNFGQVFNTAIKACDLPKEVPECSDYYIEYFTEYFANLGPGEVPAPEIFQAAVSSGFKVPQVAKRIRVKPGEGVLAAGIDGVRRRRPAAATDGERPKVIAPFHGPQTVDAETLRLAGKTKAPRPAAVRRRRPSPRKTTTTPAPVDYADDYVYYDDYPAEEAGAAKPAATRGGFSPSRPASRT